jgi:hypothetical protein
MNVARSVVARRLTGLLALACAGLAGSVAVADEPLQRDMQASAQAITLTNVPTMRVYRDGRWEMLPGPGAFSTREGCEQTATHTNANFSGGNYIVQAGFADGELVAATYTLPANAFPIIIKSAEQIFATSNAISQTTTEWSIQFFAGTPSTGQLLLSESSDDVILPHIRVGPGTAGVNVQFSIDPNDPDQLIIQNNGSNQFTVAWRIDRHNQPSTNPCVTAPASNRNAFPVVDTTGVQTLTGNWLFGLNCGPFGCPANGGWTTFQGLLAGLCRPSGDWVTRVVWDSVNCPTIVGGCCLPDGTCQVITQTACTAANGTYRGNNTTCVGANCPLPTGACCFGNGFCIQSDQAQCSAGGGTFLGNGVQCGASNTCPTGACCLPNGTCIGGVTSGACTSQGGTFRGIGSLCSGQNCPQPAGACCVNNGAACFNVTQAVCSGIPGSTWLGGGTSCVDNNGNGQADACEPASNCGDIDFNNDSLFPDDSDLVDYITVLAGGVCSTGSCDSIDFNGDGLFPDDGDFVTFLCVLAGGDCCP